MNVLRRSWLIMMLVVASSAASASEHVILLHGLARSSRSMAKMGAALRAADFGVVNVDYPSRMARVEALADEAIARGLAECRRDGATKIHFVTHSLGGLLVRSYLARHTVPELGRVVMLGPPNQGSEVVDEIGGWWLFRKINGPAGAELGTSADAMPNKLGPVTYPVGVIAGKRSINWINSMLIPGVDDGKVSVERTKVSGMTDHVVVSATHPFLMRDDEAIRQTIALLRWGRFSSREGWAVR